MRIKENIHDDCESYSCELQERVIEVFQYTSQILEIKRLLTEIKREAHNLRGIFWTEEEVKGKKQALSFFDARMQATVYYTLRNMEGYQQHGWKELIYKGEDRDGSINFI
ncbi:hypothetical protein SAMN05446037_103427 [Anaerovirgula multivorans]|uniref:Uncharacterized protein n=1 Tax=Anaerovirgula multivorans TaxID=312168 RepID=A0A239JC11_9FIRM|nr:hypothetical protein [Anaerovirgula multivorans]SNT02833.1 hypothetical protein SAMN05446037_103427 [Anaerovirgula multivorans]